MVPHLLAVARGLTTGPDARQGQPPGLEQLIGRTETALDELRTVCRGLFPALLERRGLVPALADRLAHTHAHTRVEVDDSADRRLPRAVEAAAYLFCVEMAPADRPGMITLRVENDRLVAAVVADDAGANENAWSDTTTTAAAWQHCRDRVAALDGAVHVHSSGRQATITAIIPVKQR